MTENLRAVIRRVRHLVERQYKCWREDLRPALAGHGLRFLSFDELSEADRAGRRIFTAPRSGPCSRRWVWTRPILFPSCSTNRSTASSSSKSRKRAEWRQRLAVVQVPRVLPPAGEAAAPRLRRAGLLFLGALIGHYLADLFPGTTVRGFWHFRVTRNSELYIDEEETASLRQAVENELLNRRRGDAVRLEVEHGCPLEIRARLLENLAPDR